MANFNNITVSSPDKKATVKAGSGNDKIDAQNYNGDLYAYAGMGSDIIYASQGNNYLYGESGTNTFVINPDSQNTVISAGKGVAIIDFSDVELPSMFFNGKNPMINEVSERVKNDLVITIDVNKTVTIKDFYKQRGEILFGYNDGEDKLIFDSRKLYLSTDLEGTKIKNFTGGRLNEEISGNELNNTLKGGDGNDDLFGGEGNDKLYGDNGIDRLKGNEGNDTLYAGEGAEKYLSGGEDDDVIYGSNTGIDYIDGGTGNNKLYGGKGVNNYFYYGGHDTIYLVEDSETNLYLDYYTIEEKVKIGNDLKLFLDDGNGKGGSILLKDYFKIQGIGNTVSVYTGHPDYHNVADYPFDENFNSELNLYDYNVIGKGTIKGTQYNDIINGSTKADKIYAVAGSDIIVGAGGNDTIYGGDSSSTVYFSNQDGNDKLYGDFSNLIFDSIDEIDTLSFKKVGDDLVINHSECDSVTLVGYFTGKSDAEYISVGRDGEDGSKELSVLLDDYKNTLTYNKGDGSVKFYTMPNGTNTINFDGYTSDDLAKIKVNAVKSGNNLVILGIGNKNDKITIVDYYKDGIDVDFQFNGMQIEPLSEMMKIVYNMQTSKFNGTIYNDIVTGTNGNDVIKTKDGHDTIYSSDGNDTIYAGGGNDIINYSDRDGNLKVYGESGNDIITTGAGFDTIYGGAGDDLIVSGNGNDKIYGGNGNDYIEVGDDSDFVDGGAGNDTIYGGDGDDILKGGKGNDLIYSGGGVNTIYGGAGDDRIYIKKDSLNTSDNIVHGDAGNDNIEVEEENRNIIYGDAGDDCITVYAGSSSNKIYGGSGKDSIYINSVNNEIYAGSGNDYLEIKGENNEIDAGSGNDTIMVNKDFKEIEGGSGNDTFIIKGGGGEIEDSAGNDTYVIDKIEQNAVIKIDDSKGKDIMQLAYKRNEANFLFINIGINKKGNIVDLKDTDLHIFINGEEQGVIIDDYFGSGCIERIETADGYYITKDQMNSVAHEVAAWLDSNGLTSAEQGFESENVAELLAIYQGINWQQ